MFLSRVFPSVRLSARRISPVASNRQLRDYAAKTCSDANWKEVVEQGSHTQPVIVDFTAAWCGPCRVLGPVLEEAVSTAGGVTLAAYDIDESSERAEEFRVSAVPSVYAFSKGKKVAEFKGAIPAPLVVQFVNQVKQLHDKPQ